MVRASSEFQILTLKIERVLMFLVSPMYGEHGPDSTGFFETDPPSILIEDTDTENFYMR